MIRPTLTEAIGTYFLILAVVLCVNNPHLGVLTPFPIVATLVSLIYAGGPISRAHYNPVVSLVFWLSGELKTSHLLPFIAAQILAGILAVWTSVFLLVEAEWLTVALGDFTDHLLAGILAETLGTFALVFVILQVAIGKAGGKNDYYGVAIGLSVLGSAYALGGFTGGIFNPAVAISAVTAGMLPLKLLIWVLLGNLLGSLLAWVFFRWTHGQD
ncbi:MAG: aquaporin [Bacteroidota bacterium]